MPIATIGTSDDRAEPTYCLSGSGAIRVDRASQNGIAYLMLCMLILGCIAYWAVWMVHLGAAALLTRPQKRVPLSTLGTGVRSQIPCFGPPFPGYPPFWTPFLGTPKYPIFPIFRVVKKGVF